MIETHIDRALKEAANYLNQIAARRMLRKVAAEAGLGYDWLCMLHQGRIKNPTTGLINRLLQHKQQAAMEPHEHNTTH